MTANHTKVMLRSLSAGELQQFSVELLPRLYSDWGHVTQSGTVETLKTRKGTPDAFCERSDESMVYIQSTGDTAKGKMYEDLKKSVKQLIELDLNEGALCISFLSYDPQADEVTACKKLCRTHQCEFKFYSNSIISDLLDSNHHDLRYKYLKIPAPVKGKYRSDNNFVLTASTGSEPKTATKMNNVVNWNLSPDELTGTLESIVEFYNRLKNLNEPSRQFFSTIIKLADPLRRNPSMMTVPYSEMTNVSGRENYEIRNQMAILEKHPKLKREYKLSR
ncbi:hypothetical protein [Paenibacillus anaericanus]|nr:hypothetical protein [Paenibacillus anaericanus]